MAPSRHPAPASGQASVEYVAAVTLAAVALAGAGAVAAVPGLGPAVARTVRTGLCIVGGDVCRPADAAAAGLAPCELHRREDGGGVGVTLASFHFGADGEWSATRRSDGSVGLALTGSDTTGLDGGVGFTIGALGVDVGADASVGLRVRAAKGWEFPDEAGARRFLAALPRSALDGGRWPPSWHSAEGGDEVAAGLAVAGHGATLAGARATADAIEGARFDADGTHTLYIRADLGHPEVTGPHRLHAGGGTTTLLAEYTSDPQGPRELALRRVEARRGGARVVETVGRLDLRDPASRELAWPLVAGRTPPWPPTEARRLRAVLRRIAQVGTIERATYAVRDDSRSYDLAAKLGLALGLQASKTKVERTLVGATARTQGSAERRRVDCEGGP